ncbi:MAG: VCBS repeat-containing protein [Caldilineaceae bacterium]|nr:VCBS repeat-containing protein [Caldilineaceae bacterium]
MPEITRREFLQYSSQLASAVAATVVAAQFEPLTALAKTTTANEPGYAQSAGDVLSLPKGGGAIQSIGETFSASPFTGTGNFSVPIATSPGRAGFGPQLTLQYSTGNGNGPFGLGWQLSIPRVTRKTEKGLPRYRDCNLPTNGTDLDTADCDVFVLSGAEDLVPFLENVDGQWKQHERSRTVDDVTYRVLRYRPRTETFDRIERWQSPTGGDVHWRAITKENVTSVYGRTSQARILDPSPNKQHHIFEWLLEETFDAKGNHIQYEYAQELKEPDVTRLGQSEEHRDYSSQRYIRRILYGNIPHSTELLDTKIPKRRNHHYLFEVLFDYGDIAENPDTPYITPQTGDEPTYVEQTANDWYLRPDPFSTYRAGFEVRTLRRCHRVLMYHHFPELAEAEKSATTLVKATEFTYRQNPNTQISLLAAATVKGYRWAADKPGYIAAAMPPITFGYSEFALNTRLIQTLQGQRNQLPAMSLSNANLTLVDLHGNGLPDFLYADSMQVRYWQNLGNGQFSLPRSMAQIPAGFSLSASGLRFTDMGGDGRVDLLVNNGIQQGIYESTGDAAWKPFRPIPNLPTVMDDPNLRQADLTGDGLPDFMLTYDEHFLWYRSLGEKGYAEAEVRSRRYDINRYPDVSFNDPSGRIRLADMNGDGLTDIVEIHNGGVAYWPNLGYGYYGPRIQMHDAPHFGYAFDPARLFLVDIDGSGCADIAYVDDGEIQFFFNQSGNGWSAPQPIKGLRFNNTTNLQFTDIFGNGTACLLWSTDLSRRLQHNYKVLDLCAGIKPLLLTEMSNNMGATTRIKYGTSTQHWLRDKAENKPWATPLPFPVQVVDKVEVIDHVSKTKLVTTYAYHHGYFDGAEREFRGFGGVDQLDTETFDDFSKAGLHDEGTQFNNVELAFHAPPVLTKNWYHTGAYLDDEQTLAQQYQNEFWQQDKAAFVLDGHIVSPNREAHRAMRGSLLRTEVYAQDNVAQAQHPYTVTEHRYQVEEIQARRPVGSSLVLPNAVYEPRVLETLTYHYEREPADPRIAHEMTLAFDKFGNVADQIAIAYPRRALPVNLPEQGKILAVYTKSDYINTPELTEAGKEPDYHYIGLPYQRRTYEVTGLRWPPDQSERQFRLSDFDDLNTEKDDGEQTEESIALPQRLLKWNRTYFRPDDEAGILDGHPLALGKVESLALPYASYQVALSDALIKTVFVKNEGAPSFVTDDMLTEAQYHQEPGIDGYWWVPAGRQAFDPAKFYLPHRSSDPFGNFSTIAYDKHGLLVTQTTDPMGNRMLAQNDYRVLQPAMLTDPNGNRSTVAYDALGLVVGTAVMGKNSEGDSLAGFRPDLGFDELNHQRDDLDHFFDRPRLPRDSDEPPPGMALLADATTRIVYDLHRFYRTQTEHPDDPDQWQPVYAATLARETHVSDLEAAHPQIQISFSYSDGFGREIQKKVMAEPGPIAEGGENADPRWVGSGWTIFNNKGKPVRQFEPFFSASHAFEFAHQTGVSPILFYDPLQRVVATLHPNHTYEKVDFDAWSQTTWDVNDTATFDPRDDVHVKGFLVDPEGELRLATSEYIPSWYDVRTKLTYAEERQRRWPASNIRTAQTRAAQQTAVHVDTPSTVHLDPLGRPILTLARNRVACADHSLDGKEEEIYTRVELDIEGNQRQVWDDRRLLIEHLPMGEREQRIVMQYYYDMLGNRIHQASMEAGARWMLNDVLGKPLYAWDSRDHIFTTTYDALRRPLGQYVRGTVDESDPRTRNTTNGNGLLVDKIEYGEDIPYAEALNLRTRVYRHFDAAGVVTNAQLDANDTPVAAYDFKGNLLHSTRRLATRYWQIPDWSQDSQPQLESERFEASTRYDALNRPIQSVAPHSSRSDAKRNIIQPVFNEANLLERVDVWLERATEPTALLDAAVDIPSPVGVANINYNAKGQRQQIDYKNGVSTRYEYDPLTFRLTHLRTWRNAAAFPLDCPQPPPVEWAGCQVQNLHYTYDPAGNITHIHDDAQQTIYFRNQRVEPSSNYTYDALYRLICATGREHLGQQANGARKAPTAPDAFNAFHTTLDHPGNGQAMGTYREFYVYDDVGNFLEMEHRGTDPKHPGWARSYNYEQASLLESGKQSNRLSSTKLRNGDSEPYQYDVHGNMVRMPHLGNAPTEPNMHWDYKDQLHQVDLVGGGTAYYVYDAAGQRVRKVTENANGDVQDERIYLGGFELYREYHGNNAGLVRETLHIMDDKQRIVLVETRNEVDDGTAMQLIRYQIGNHLGSASLELNEQAKIISYEEYFPYGSTSYQAVDKEMKAAAKRYRYTGKERDEESGFYYHGARYYAQWLGRWTSCDPIGIFESTNLFVFTLNSPNNRTDQNGQSSAQAVESGLNIKIHNTTEHSIPKDQARQIEEGFEAKFSFLKNTAHIDASLSKTETEKSDSAVDIKVFLVDPESAELPEPVLKAFEHGGYSKTEAIEQFSKFLETTNLHGGMTFLGKVPDDKRPLDEETVYPDVNPEKCIILLPFGRDDSQRISKQGSYMPGPGMLYTESEANENVKQITDKLIQYGTHEIGHAFGLAHHLHRKGSQNVHLMDPDIVNISPEQRKFGASVLVRVWLRQKQKSRLNRGFNEQEFLRNRLQKLLKNRK